MKRILLFTSAVIICYASHAQIKVNSLGNVGIGGSAVSDYKVNITGGDIKWQNTSYYPFYFKPNSMDPALYSENDFGYLGLYNKQFYRVYARYIYMNGQLVSTSDIKTKENIRNI